jgi:hypothetical protein
VSRPGPVHRRMCVASEMPIHRGTRSVTEPHGWCVV